MVSLTLQEICSWSTSDALHPAEKYEQERKRIALARDVKELSSRMSTEDAKELASLRALVCSCTGMFVACEG